MNCFNLLIRRSYLIIFILLILNLLYKLRNFKKIKTSNNLIYVTTKSVKIKKLYNKN